MANKKIFASTPSKTARNPLADTVNSAGGIAYSRTSEDALAQLAVTGTFNGTFYASGEQTLDEVLKLAQECSPQFLAELAVYSRESAFMKDSSALLLAVLMTRDINRFQQVFNRVIDNGKMLRTFCQIVRSGKVGRKSFGSAAKRMIQQWIQNRPDHKLMGDVVGNDPSLADVVKMVHPRPRNETQESFFAYLIGKEKNPEKLPEIVKEFEAFKKATPGNRKVPNVPFQLLSSQNLTTDEWAACAESGGFHMVRMNLNTFGRHGVYDSQKNINMIAAKLSDKELVKRSKVFPYQLYTAYLNADSVPQKISNALQDAMEVATMNVPSFGKVLVGVDYSGSMGAPVTGARGSATTKVTCNMVASLMAACVVRNSDATVYRFDTHAQKISLNPRDSVVTNAKKIGANGGGTDCASFIKQALQDGVKADVVICLSDNESWANPYGMGRSNLMVEWERFLAKNPGAKLICIDLAANTTVQSPSRKNVLNIGGFSDEVFTVIKSFIDDAHGSTAWREKIAASLKAD
jgi:60 kDa SS-A/Ro ribonucleoprotein